MKRLYCETRGQRLDQRPGQKPGLRSGPGSGLRSGDHVLNLRLEVRIKE